MRSEPSMDELVRGSPTGVCGRMSKQCKGFRFASMLGCFVLQSQARFRLALIVDFVLCGVV